jgi:cysteine desulfurase/selenocysteine lyase
MTLRGDAGRYESGTLNTIGCYGLRASLDFLAEIGVGNLHPVVQALGDRIVEGAQAIGFECAAPRNAGTGSGIVSIRKPGVESQLIVRRLKDAGIIAAPRQGWVRLSPHFYISPADIDRVLSELQSICS